MFASLLTNLLLLLVYPGVLLLVHKVFIFFNRNSSEQVVVLKCCFFSIFVYLILVWFLIGVEPAAFLFNLISVFCLAYIYFHFFNMSTTARRIKILTGLQQGQFTKREQIETYYAGQSSLKTRIDRLIHLGELKQINGRYVVSRGILHNAGKLIYLCQRLLAIGAK